MDGCRAALHELGKTIERRVGKRALTAAAKKLADRHKQALPVSADPYDPTRGSLKGAPTVKAAKGGKGRPAVAMVIEDPAAAPGEFGTHKMKPHLKVRSTTDAMRGELGATMAEALKQEVDQAARAAAKKAR